MQEDEIAFYLQLLGLLHCLHQLELNLLGTFIARNRLQLLHHQLELKLELGKLHRQLPDEPLLAREEPLLVLTVVSTFFIVVEATALGFVLLCF
jgi:hypothetical protein